MHYEGAIFRPPSEAESILLQVTIGCSHNRCHFCGAYREKRFRIQDDEIIRQDLRYAAAHLSDSKRLFLCDGDALIIPQTRLLGLLADINTHLPGLQRVGSYANAKSLARKSLADLVALREQGLKLIHMGLESGDDETLRKINKWGSSQDIIEQGKKVKDAGITLFVTIIVGLGGKRRSVAHAEKTGEALTKMSPDFVGALSLMPVEGTELYAKILSGNFEIIDPDQTLRELRIMLEHTDLSSGTFYANHASNFLPLKVRFSGNGKAQALSAIDAALRGEIPLKPEWMRGL
jgi:radical SAM superfamily enzyme YgiQ (UPF0313 family)